MNAENFIRVAGHDLVDAHSAFRAVCNNRAWLSAAVIDWKKDFFLDVQSLNNQHRLAELTFRILGVRGAEKELSTHLASNVFDLLNWLNNVNAWSESWLDEGTFSTSFSLHLSFNNESSRVIIAKLAANCESFFRVKCDVASWNRDVVSAHQVSRLVLVKTDVAHWHANEVFS